MLTSLKVKDFQSLADVEMEFPTRESGGFLVTVVGPSSSGKSAVVRALRLLLENSAYPAVRAGAKSTTVEAQMGEVAVGITRGKSLSTYHIRQGEETALYQKSGKTVPDAVAEVFNMKNPSLHIASQFDPPYLLDIPASQVSRAVGQFSNAQMLQDAAREGSLRKQRLKMKADLHQKELEEAVDVAADLLEVMEAKQVRLESLDLEPVETALERFNSLSALLDTFSTLEDAVEALEGSKQAFTDHSTEFSVLEGQISRLADLESLVRQVTTLKAEAQKQMTDFSSAVEAANQYQHDYETALKEAGICPVCEQVIP